MLNIMCLYYYKLFKRLVSVVLICIYFNKKRIVVLVITVL
ncbi:hypothetical protein C530_210 [Candidatus Portiera aleyrodidarum BT-B-HRs]|nr:hypothetical protein C548_209 [Candidatus Portiera aleyrodidarum BT-QVLC]AFT80853.1 hypothetical protein C530_210 [Candidatus Portiera aleyrodidarum BT-B-HRs]